MGKYKFEIKSLQVFQVARKITLEDWGKRFADDQEKGFDRVINLSAFICIYFILHFIYIIISR